MSNEELAARIQAGERELIPELWEQVRRFVWMKARSRYLLTDGYGGVEVEDLAQSGFLALLEAVEDFKPEGEYKFLSYLGNHLKKAFAEAGGYRSLKRDPLDNCTSLDTPLGDDPDSDTLLDLQADPADNFEDVEHQVWLQQLHEALERAMNDLPERQRDTLHRRYWKGETLRDISKADGATIETVRQWEKRAIRSIKRKRNRYGLDQFLEARTPYYAPIGPASFNTTHTSAVELAVLKRERLEEHFVSRLVKEQRFRLIKRRHSKRKKRRVSDSLLCCAPWGSPRRGWPPISLARENHKPHLGK